MVRLPGDLLLARGGVLSRRGSRGPPSRRKGLRLLGLAAIVLGGLLCSSAAWLVSPWGGARLAELIERQVNRRIAGELRIGRLRLTTSGLEAERVLILDDAGRPTIAVAELSLTLDLAALLVERRLVVEELALSGSRVEVALAPWDPLPSGTTISRAFRARTPRPVQPPGPRPRRQLPPEPPLPIELRSLRIEGAAFRLAPYARGPALVLARELGVSVEGLWRQGASLELTLAGQALAPVAAPLGVHVRAAFASDWLEAEEVRISLGTTELVITGVGEMRLLDGRLRVSGLLGAAEARAYGVPLAGDLRLGADVHLSRPVLETDLRLSAGEGGVTLVQASLDPRTLAARALVVVEELDPSAYLRGAPAGRLSGSLRLEGGLKPLDLELLLALRGEQLAGEPVGPVSARGRLQSGRATLSELRATLPGGELTASAELVQGILEAKLQLSATELASITRLARRLGAPPLQASGPGELRLTLSGTRERQQLGGRLRVDRLQLGEVAARGLALSGQLRLGEALPSGRLSLGAAQLRSGSVQLGKLRLEALRDPGGKLRLRGDEGGGRHRLLASGALVPGELRLDRFRLVHPRGTLSLDRPSTLRFGPGRLSIDELALSGPGGLSGTLALDGDRLALTLRARGLVLDRLPQQLIPLPLRGRVNGRLSFSREGAEPPEAELSLALSNGQIGKFVGSAVGQARFGAGRGSGELRLGLAGVGTGWARFDLPFPLERGLPGGRGRGERVSLQAGAGPVSLHGLARLLQLELPGGTASLRLRASGYSGSPEVELSLLAAALRARGSDAEPLALLIKARASRGQVAVAGSAQDPEGRILELHAEGPLRLPALLANPLLELGTSARARGTSLHFEAQRLPLAPVSALLGRPLAGGTLSGRLEVQGPLRDPRGAAALELVELPLGQCDPTGGRCGAEPLTRLRRGSASIQVELSEQHTRLAAEGRLDGAPAGRLVAELAAPISVLLPGGEGDPSAALELALDVPPIRLGAAVKERRGAGPAPLAAVVEGRGRVSGTLGSAIGELRIVARQVRLRGVPIGDAELSLSGGEELRAELQAIDAAAGTLSASATLGLPLRPLRLLRQGVGEPRELQLVLDVAAAGASLAGLAAVPAIASAGGQLDGQLSARGPLGALASEGELHLAGGRLELQAGPTFERIGAVLSVSGDRVVLRDVSASAPGGGRLSASGWLQLGRGSFGATARTRRFPLGGAGGAVGFLTGEVNLSGSASRRKGLLADVVLSEGQLEVAVRSPRTVQPVSRHPDVTVVSGPEANRRRRRQRISSAERALPVEVRLRTTTPALVVGDDVQGRLLGDLRLSRRPDATWTARGALSTPGGRLQVIGKRFELQQSSLRFDEVPLPAGKLDVHVRHDTGSIRTFIVVSGPISSPEVQLRSEPPLSEAQIALLIASGRSPFFETDVPPQLQEGEGVASEEVATAAVSVAGSYAAQRLRQTLAPKLPLDVFAIEAGEQGTRLQAGTFVGKRLYVGYLRELLPVEGENANEVQAVYELGRHFSLFSRFGDAATGGLDLRWERSFATPAQRRRREEQRQAPTTPEQQPGAPARESPALPAPAQTSPGGAPRSRPRRLLR